MVGQIDTGPFGWRKTGQPIKDSFIGSPTLVILIRTAPIPTTILHFLTLYILCTLEKTSRLLPDFSNTRRTSMKKWISYEHIRHGPEPKFCPGVKYRHTRSGEPSDWRWGLTPVFKSKLLYDHDKTFLWQKAIIWNGCLNCHNPNGIHCAVTNNWCYKTAMPRGKQPRSKDTLSIWRKMLI